MILHLSSLFDHKMPDRIALEQAIADLESQTSHNYYATANKYGLNANTLKNRFTGKTASRSTAQVEANGILSPTQEEVLVDRINYLSERGMPPTPQYVVNLVQEMVEKEVGNYWISCFIKRHDDEFCSIYLDNINYARRVADNSCHFDHYFKQVSAHLFFRIFKICTNKADI